MLDGLSPALRHLVLILASAALAWVGSDLVPYVDKLPSPYSLFVGPLLLQLINYLTPWFTTQYGAGSNDVGSSEV